MGGRRQYEVLLFPRVNKRKPFADIYPLNNFVFGIKTARLAQSVEHETLNLRVVGSSPTLGEQFFVRIFFFVIAQHRGPGGMWIDGSDADPGYYRKKGSPECRDPGSNRGPLDLQSNALPTELSRLAFAMVTIHVTEKILSGSTEI